MKESIKKVRSGGGWKSLRRMMLFSLSILVLIGAILTGYSVYVTAAAATVSIVDIDYEAQTLTVKANSGDSMIFYSNKAQTTWEVVPGELVDNQITMDISFITKTSNYVLSLKGDKSTTPITVTLPKQTNKFRVSLDYTTNTLSMNNTEGATEVYWRKADTTTWNTIRVGNMDDLDNFKNEVERFSVQGITLYFRLGQEKGTSASSVGKRPSKETVLKIAKRATKPSVTTSFEKQTLTLKTSLEYKSAESDDWIAIERGKTVQSMKSLASAAFYSETNTEPKDVLLDVRTKATYSKSASQCNTITIPAQKQTHTENIDVNFIGSTQFQIDITETEIVEDDEKVKLPAASSSNPYEYTIVEEDSSLSDTATWKSITSSATKIKKEDAPVGSKIYIRKKATSTALATVPYKVTINGYPSASSVTTTELKKISGVDTTFTFPITVPNKDTTISSITFAGKEVTFTTKKAKLISESTMYSMDVTITSVENVEAVSSNLEKTLTATITLDNGDTIEEGLTLYISPATTVETSKSYEKYLDLSFEDTISFVLELNSEKKSGVTISKITYNDQNVEFKQTSDTGNLEIKVTIDNKAQFDTIEDSLTFAKLGTSLPFVITLSSDEVISSGITMKIKPIISTSSSTNGFGVSAGTYKAALATETTTDDLTNPVISLTIDEDIYKEYDLIISSVSWNGREIIGTYSNSANVTSLTLSIPNMIDNLDFDAFSSYSDYVKVTLKKKNGDVFNTITTSYKITVVK